ncbi:MAG: TetR/AcrR family transcriptional regulator [Cytophagales bacterium]|nr:TetR/AcrR family transcriptional regulator [Armatimonadota bacterium]
MNRRDSILLAASKVVQQSGAEALTLEAVAQAAGISKGGLLYHFPNKEALLKAMVAEMIALFNTEIASELAAEDGPETGRWLRAYVRATLTEDSEFDAVTQGLFAAFASNPDLLTPAREAAALWQAQAQSDGLDPGLAATIRLAADGFWLSSLFGLEPTDPGHRASLRDFLLAMTR